jgi:hypothetical protein
MSSIDKKYFDIPTQYALLFGRIDSCNKNENNMTNNKPTAFESVCRAQEALGGIRELPSEGTFERLADSTHNKMFDSKRGQELLFKAEQYNMPVDRKNIDWLQLIDQIEEYETLLSEARDVGVIWDETEYDPLPLQQEIEEAIHRNVTENSLMFANFYASRGVEV